MVDEKEYEYVKSIGKQIAESEVIYCPRCLEEDFNGGKLKQPLSAVGDYENELFCPHCDMVILVVLERV